VCNTYRFGVVRGERPGPEHCYLHGRGADDSCSSFTAIKLIFPLSEMRGRCGHSNNNCNHNNKFSRIYYSAQDAETVHRSTRSTANKTRRRRRPLNIIVVVVAGVSRTCCPLGGRSAFDERDSRGLRLTARRRSKYSGGGGGSGDGGRRICTHSQRKKARAANPLSPANCKVKGVYNDKNLSLRKTKLFCIQIMSFLNNAYNSHRKTFY